VNSAKHLWSLAGEITAIIETWLREHEGKLLYAHFKRVDTLRLTRLQVWSWRHRVSIDEILSLTLPYLRKSTSGAQKSRYGLGCSVAALTGMGNEKILIEAIKLKYPGAEHRDIWRHEQRRRQLEAEAVEDSDGLQIKPRTVKSLLECDSVSGYIKSYREQVISTRRKMDAAISAPKRRRKLYQDNPWF
jgi:hypothetical protein